MCVRVCLCVCGCACVRVRAVSECLDTARDNTNTDHEEIHEVGVVLDAVLDLCLAGQVVHCLDAVVDLLQRQVGRQVGRVGRLDDDDAEPEEGDDDPHGRGLWRVVRGALQARRPSVAIAGGPRGRCVRVHNTTRNNKEHCYSACLPHKVPRAIYNTINNNTHHTRMYARTHTIFIPFEDDHEPMLQSGHCQISNAKEKGKRERKKNGVKKVNNNTNNKIERICHGRETSKELVAQ